MTLRRFWPAFGLTVLLSISQAFAATSGDQTVSPDAAPAAEKSVEAKIREETAQALKTWFEGDAAGAEKIFARLTKDGCKNPVPYQALALILSDRHERYDEVAALYSRHKVLSGGGSADYRAALGIIKKYADKGSPQALVLLARVTGWD